MKRLNTPLSHVIKKHKGGVLPQEGVFWVDLDLLKCLLLFGLAMSFLENILEFHEKWHLLKWWFSYFVYLLVWSASPQNVFGNLEHDNMARTTPINVPLFLYYTPFCCGL